MPPGVETRPHPEANMSRRQPKLVVLTLASSLLLAVLPARAQARPAAREVGLERSQATDFIHLLWMSFSNLWSPRPWTSIRGGEGGSLDPNGKPLGAGTSIVPPVPPSDEGGSLDPDGHH
jgi:hypothetical protein